MARARNIKPGFFSNDLLAEIEPLGRILFAGLWTIADREGRIEDRVKKIKAGVLPYDECDCGALLQALHDNGFILRYTTEGQRFIQIVKWAEHQNPHMKEVPSSIPAPDKNSASTVQDTTLTGTSPADSLNPLPITDSLNPLPITDSLNPLPMPAAGDSEVNREFEKVWEAYPQRPGASKADSLKAWKARVKDGAKPDEILDGVMRYSHFVTASNTEANYIKQPATFFGPGEHFKSDWKVAARAGPLYQTANEKQKSIADRLTGRTKNEQPLTLIDIN